jgi:hypothetical protein
LRARFKFIPAPPRMSGTCSYAPALTGFSSAALDVLLARGGRFDRHFDDARIRTSLGGPGHRSLRAKPLCDVRSVLN